MRCRTILVDDEPLILEELKLILENNENIEVVGAYTDSLEVLKELSVTRPDCALLDIEMVGLSGIELAEKLTEHNPEIKVLFITAYNHYATQAFEVNAIDYILKPVREERLLKVMDKLMTKMVKPQEKAEESKLSINMFRKFTVRRGDELIKWNRKKSPEILAYLLENRKYPVHKAMLCELFWPDSEPQKALMNLQINIYSIRKALEINDNEQMSIEYAGDNYYLKMGDSLTDVDKFESLLQQQKASGLNDSALLKQAASLYTGDYLEEEGWLWAEPKKVLLQKKYQSVMELIKK